MHAQKQYGTQRLFALHSYSCMHGYHMHAFQENAEAGLLANASGFPPTPRKTPRMRIPGTKGWTASGNPSSITLLDLLATLHFKPGKNPNSVFLESVPRVSLWDVVICPCICMCY